MDDRTSIPTIYVAAWHEPDADKRRRTIRELWAEDCSYCNTQEEFHGRSGIEQAVTEAHEEYVKKGFVFTVTDVDVNHDAVRYQWVMTPSSGGEPAAAGTHIVTVDAHGMITTDHQFPDRIPARGA